MRNLGPNSNRAYRLLLVDAACHYAWDVTDRNYSGIISLLLRLFKNAQ